MIAGTGDAELHMDAAIDRDGLSGNVGCLFGAEESDHVGDLLRGSESAKGYPWNNHFCLEMLGHLLFKNPGRTGVAHYVSLGNFNRQ